MISLDMTVSSKYIKFQMTKNPNSNDEALEMFRILHYKEACITVNFL